MMKFLAPALAGLALVTCTPIGGHGARAADLGGDCCTDLEQRVATLEAEAARKGNRKVSMVISGKVNESILYGTATGEAAHTYIMTNPNDQSEIDFSIEGKIGKGWAAGAYIEMPISAPSIFSPGGTLQVKQEYVWVRMDAIQLALGQINAPSRYIEEEGVVDLADVAPAFDLSTVAAWATAGFFTNAELFPATTANEAVRADITPAPGLTISGYYAPGPGTTAIEDAAVRYRGTIAKDIILQVGVGWDRNTASNDDVFKGSAGIMEKTSGLFVQVAAAHDQLTSIQGESIQGGIRKELLGPIGATTLFAEYEQLQNVPGLATPYLYGGGIKQDVDAAALELYLDARRYELKDPAGSSATTVLGGVKVNF